MAKRIQLYGNKGIQYREQPNSSKVPTPTLGLYFSTAANVAAVETEFTNTVPVGSVVFATGGIFFRDASGGTTNGWKTVTIS